MGTSQSSSGPLSGVPLVPPWVPDVSEPDDESSEPNGTDDQESTTPMPEVAPKGRWRGTRLHLRKFARSGSTTDMRKGLGHYVRGLGGSRTAVRRFGGTTKTADRLYGALTNLARGQTMEPGSPLDPALLEGRTAGEIMDAIIEVVRPIDGSQDAEAERLSINNALSELLARFPDADLLALSPEQREFAIERFVANDVYNRFSLDVGGAIISNAPSTAAGLSRLREVKDYIREKVSATFRALRNAGEQLRTNRVTQIVKRALQQAHEIFEEYIL